MAFSVLTKVGSGREGEGGGRREGDIFLDMDSSRLGHLQSMPYPPSFPLSLPSPSLPPSLPQFSVAQWLGDCSPALPDRNSLLDCVWRGILLCGPKPSIEFEILLEVRGRFAILT